MPLPRGKSGALQKDVSDRSCAVDEQNDDSVRETDKQSDSKVVVSEVDLITLRLSRFVITAAHGSSRQCFSTALPLQRTRSPAAHTDVERCPQQSVCHVSVRRYTPWLFSVMTVATVDDLFPIDLAFNRTKSRDRSRDE